MIDTDMAEQILQGDDTHPDILQALGLELLAEVKRLRVIEEQRRRMGIVLADYCINDVCDEFFEGDYSFYEKLVKAYGWKEGDEE